MPQTYQQKKQSRLLRGLGTPNEGRKDTRKRIGPDRHKVNHHGGKVLSKWDRRYVVAWDGEGANLATGEHVYNLLANSDGSHILNHEGLSTEQCFEYFIQYSDPRAINVIYGGSYDVNMIIRDIPKGKLKELWSSGRCQWGKWEVYYTPRKRFTVKKWVIFDGKLQARSFVLWDVIGYFQSTFVSACRKWLGDLPILDDIERMKYQRNEFVTDRIKEIVEYNRQECTLLVQLMNSLFESLDKCGITLRRYDGAGSIAAALFKMYDIGLHKGDVPEDVYHWAQLAYSGGRIEAPMIGVYNGPVYRNDINSAYPSVMVDLPSYRQAEWVKSQKWDGSNNSLVHVHWFIQEEAPFYPLWYREHDGRILYPRWGEGTYWGSEIRNLTDFYEEGKDYEILEAYNCTLAYQYHPFHFVQKVYDQRLGFKKIERELGLRPGASEALKLGINSLYGKTAQQQGARFNKATGKWSIPTYHQLLWAGQTTAGARAQLYHAAMQKPDSVIAFATDALITTEPIEVNLGTGLGQWTFDQFQGITIVQPGVYFLDEGQEFNEKYRGFDKGSLNREHIIGSWILGMDYEASLTRFVGLGSALMRNDFEDVWRTWPVEQRKLGLYPNGKRKAGADREYWDHLCKTEPAVNMNVDMPSYAFQIQWMPGYKKVKPQIEGVDIDDLYEEYLDTYA